MKPQNARKKSLIRWPAFYAALLAAAVILVGSTALWMRSARSSSDEMNSDLVRFYLEEITERSAGSITAELEKKAAQMEQALTVLDRDCLKDEGAVRGYVSLVQQINGLDMFALVDRDGMVYTADSTFSGISRFGFLSEEITGQQIHVVRSYGTKTMVILAVPVRCDGDAGVPVVSCFTGLNIDSIISSQQLQNEKNKTYCRLFTRERTSTVSGIQGTGLGMAITRSLVGIMGGSITVFSEPGKGSEFVVKLQFQISKPVPTGVIPSLQGLRALVADDDADSCMSVVKMLGSIGMRAEWTTSGGEAVLRARFALDQSDEFHVYLIDWLMPDMNGIEVVRRIRRLIGDSRPIIILSAYDWSQIEEEAREAGVTAFCSKPLFMSELREILTRPVLPPDPEEEPKEPLRGGHILLAEDNELNQETAVEILRSMGFTADVVSDGEQAVERMKTAAPGQYDLILMDIQMPNMDGYKAARTIRDFEDPRKAGITIVAMTANAFEEDRQNAFRAGMNGHIAKPIRVDELLSALSDILQKNQS